MVGQGAGPQRHVVVFDCNIYLDVARIVEPPFTWDKFDAHAARLSSEPFPDPSVDALRALAVCTSGRFAGDETLEVWTNGHIDRIVRYKAQQSATPDPETGFCGLGWSSEDAEELVTVLIEDITTFSSGGTLGDLTFPDSNPPLDHEDGMVYGACRTLAGEDPLSKVMCVTKDQGFLAAARDEKLGGHSRVLSPSKFVGLTRMARGAQSMRGMVPPPSLGSNQGPTAARR